jgi:UDP-N-acetylglucosamine--N-acetylmuramyl-(pentapeptide) pyrophosphoryl-undecaprenol N-acetylglucosamine transferase
VFPGIAVAEALRKRRRRVIWLGTRHGLEARVVPEHGIEMHWVSIVGVRRRGLAAWTAAPFKIVFAVAQVLRMLHRCRPAVVLGFGGFVSGPGGIAAWISRRPLLIHEQNAIAGTTNRLLARFAKRVFEAFPGTFPPEVAAECVGNPVRAEILELAHRPAPRARQSDGRLHVLVIGGSQGARALNDCMPEAVALLPPQARPVVRHQTGRQAGDVARRYGQAGAEADVSPFIEDMAAAYAWADVVVARAGALTIAELAAAGVGALLVPYPFAVDDHQTLNARHFVDGGAGVLLPESELTPERLAAALARLIENPETVTAMAACARAMAKPDAAERLADACLTLAGAVP